MGKEYIWIDALCIEQTEGDLPGNWGKKAFKVGGYYTGVECLLGVRTDSLRRGLAKNTNVVFSSLLGKPSASLKGYISGLKRLDKTFTTKRP